jgi:thioesterase domain-containing protein
MAADYLRQVRGVQPQGPYLIGGFSFGGLVAYEMVQQLRQSGQEVALLVLVDPSPLGFSDFHGSAGNGNGSMARQSSSLNRLVTALRLKLLLAAVTNRRQRLANALKMRVCDAYLRLGQQIPSSLRMFYFFEVSGKAASRYVPSSYSGRAVLLSSDLSAAGRWRDLVSGSLEIHELPGKHLDAIKGPRAEQWGRQLAVCLTQAVR